MSFSKQALVVAATLVFGIPIAHAQDDDAFAAQSVRAPCPPKPWRQVRGLGRVLDLSKPPVVIDEPGLYAIQQNWRIPDATRDAVPELIQITADDVTLDLHGFTISTDAGAELPSTLFVITGNSAEIRSGGIEPEGLDAAVHSTGGGPWLHHLSVRSVQREITFEGDGTTISDSHIVGLVVLAGESSLERNTLAASGSPAATLTGDGNRMIDNRIVATRSGVLIRILGDGNIVANNVIEAGGLVHDGFGVDGDRNVLRGNTVFVGLGLQRFIRISGTGNTLDGNIAARAPDQEERADIGLEFTADGNYYGNNRIAALVPFALGGTVQTDWGGNVSY